MRAPFTVLAIWPEALEKESSSIWRRTIVREEAAGLGRPLAPELFSA
jgi:hypothetical protein